MREGKSEGELAALRSARSWKDESMLAITLDFMVKMSRHLSAAKRLSRSGKGINKSPVGPRSTEDRLVSLEDLALRRM
jgi:hypothetical protein